MTRGGPATPLSALELLDQVVSLLKNARGGGWEISSTIAGDFEGTDHFRLDIWRKPPAESPRPQSEAKPSATSVTRDEPLPTRSEGES